MTYARGLLISFNVLPITLVNGLELQHFCEPRDQLRSFASNCTGLK
jgi:hypothetical protein